MLKHPLGLVMTWLFRLNSKVGGWGDAQVSHGIGLHSSLHFILNRAMPASWEVQLLTKDRFPP